jgi:hypothetical protein
VSVELIPIYFHCFEIFNSQIGETAFCKPDFIIVKSNYEYFQNAQKGESFLDDFEALVREIDVRGCLLRNVILKVACFLTLTLMYFISLLL